jgi:ornithine cyclodeaminase/alanine dehydrogenase-like protein (mu-crystallin family)
MCATNTIDHVYFEHWVEPGMHLSSIKRPEIEPAAIKRAQRVVIHTHDASPMLVTPPGLAVPEREEGKGWSLLKEIDFDNLPTLPELVAGKISGRAAPEHVTCFLNNIGMGYQFAAVGATVYGKAKALGRGHEVPTEWFTQDVHT